MLSRCRSVVHLLEQVVAHTQQAEFLQEISRNFQVVYQGRDECLLDTCSIGQTSLAYSLRAPESPTTSVNVEFKIECH
jgi:hypothetical protein